MDKTEAQLVYPPYVSSQNVTSSQCCSEPPPAPGPTVPTLSCAQCLALRTEEQRKLRRAALHSQHTLLHRALQKWLVGASAFFQVSLLGGGEVSAVFFVHVARLKQSNTQKVLPGVPAFLESWFL